MAKEIEEAKIIEGVKLNIGERLVALAIFNDGNNKVPTADLFQYLQDAGKFNVTEEDKKESGWEIIMKDDQVDGWKCANIMLEKNIDFGGFTKKFLAEKLAKMEFSAADPLSRFVPTLLEKLK